MLRSRPATWREYFENTKNNPPRPLLVKALGSVSRRGRALDFGSGALNDSKYLLSQGFEHVTALDKIAVAAEVAKDLSQDRFIYTISSFEEFNFPEQEFDLVNAQYALPFIRPSEFKRVFDAIHTSLKVGGVLTGQFFGDRDEWRDNPEMTFVSELEVREYLNTFNIISFQEEERDKTTAAGEMKHWHVFHVVAVKI